MPQPLLIKVGDKWVLASQAQPGGGFIDAGAPVPGPMLASPVVGSNMSAFVDRLQNPPTGPRGEPLPNPSWLDYGSYARSGPEAYMRPGNNEQRIIRAGIADPSGGYMGPGPVPTGEPMGPQQPGDTRGSMIGSGWAQRPDGTWAAPEQQDYPQQVFPRPRPTYVPGGGMMVGGGQPMPPAQSSQFGRDIGAGIEWVGNQYNRFMGTEEERRMAGDRASAAEAARIRAIPNYFTASDPNEYARRAALSDATMRSPRPGAGGLPFPDDATGYPTGVPTPSPVTVASPGQPVSVTAPQAPSAVEVNPWSGVGNPWTPDAGAAAVGDAVRGGPGMPGRPLPSVGPRPMMAGGGVSRETLPIPEAKPSPYDTSAPPAAPAAASVVDPLAGNWMAGQPGAPGSTAAATGNTDRERINALITKALQPRDRWDTLADALMQAGAATLAAGGKPGATLGGALGEGALGAIRSVKADEQQRQANAVRAMSLSLQERGVATQERGQASTEKYQQGSLDVHRQQIEQQGKHWDQQIQIEREKLAQARDPLARQEIEAKIAMNQAHADYYRTAGSKLSAAEKDPAKVAEIKFATDQWSTMNPKAEGETDEAYEVRKSQFAIQYMNRLETRHQETTRERVWRELARDPGFQSLPRPQQEQKLNEAMQMVTPPQPAPGQPAAAARPQVLPPQPGEKTATNPQTGQRAVFRNGQWIPY